MNGSYDITYEGKKAGKLKIYSDGIMTVFSAETAFCQGLLRLAVISNGKTIPIGVLSPIENGLYIKKSYSKNSLTEMGIKDIDDVIILSQNSEVEASSWRSIADPAEQFSDVDLRAACKGARGVLMLKTGETTKLAFPLRPGMPFPLMPAFCFGSPAKIEEKEYLIFTIKNGSLYA